ncbi:ABC transporter ATP-binding protein [Nocardia cyriacigeorgica]|uniref:ABC transporter ATP-binding protein n=1 Tax=Nocardia cyriacigeorgica TaxID=135487 RepID=UPI001895E54C|nr:ABC transporter ATP-binding protein [Nocardia cyriacigeorgica]MBF6099423.1 ABC transporter ATP-binding protein [Nocardia cyriacigeorgica]MBF6160252.1 ABC transporter ATP-binding protein [Nocardia cyriacigeorgica]MBF6199336.1 ABC transporter ATP-binding protein [Nocardia cyriacigeorgica]MBF6315195.1 ABC transporter ATP-binding protein [Nocardia cyriacigeorgica]MBF6529981.1 ABC transporter ATP-binding protein [Nocardia cyriacigeorgica]
MNAASESGEQDAPLLEIRELHVAFGSGAERVDAVRGVDLTVYPGQTVAIVGESGSGKSTTAHAVIGLLPSGGHVVSGEIRFAGRDLAAAPESELIGVRGNGIGFVPQDPMSNLNPVWKIGFQIGETLAANGIARGKQARERAAELLREAGIPDPEHRMNQYPHELSGGLRQRALIAIGLSGRPDLLIADEPTSALDVTVQRQILDHIDELTAQLGTAMLLITHDLGLAAERAEHLVVMYRGRVVESGPALEILRDPQHEYTRRLVESAPSLAARRRSVRVARAQVRRQAIEAAEVGVLEADAVAAEEILVVDGLTKRYRIRGSVPWKSTELLAVDDVGFRLRRGTTTAIVGESGSGKSTVAQMVLGLLEPTSGTVTFDGADVARLSRTSPLAFRRRVQPIFQNPYGSLDPMYSIHRTLTEPLRTHGIGSRAERDATVRDLLDKVALPADVLSRYPNELSGGQRQRVAIARALALSPELVVCDEAVSALDVLVQAQILELLSDLQAELGLSYLFITHDLAVVRQIADEVLVMCGGRVVEAAPTDEVFDNPREDYTRRLLDAIPGRDLLVS